jgi:hypothetical protein
LFKIQKPGIISSIVNLLMALGFMVGMIYSLALATLNLELAWIVVLITIVFTLIYLKWFN